MYGEIQKEIGKNQVAEQPDCLSRGRCYFYTEKVAAVDLVANSWTQWIDLLKTLE